MEHCPHCGEPLEADELCPVCMLARGIEREPDLPETIGRYRILRLLGEGGMGAVFEAEQEQPRRTVALKVIRPGFVNTELLRRFERESQALARLHHPGIAQVYEAGAIDHGYGLQPYFAMEFVQGQPLNRFVENLNTRQRLELMILICAAVQHAHDRGIIHRDLKPSNILVDESGQPKIVDFGVAHVTDVDAYATRQTDVGQLVGTLAYMSPEQALGDPREIDGRSDVYTLGLILYELLAGRMPYTITRQLNEAVQTIREQDPLPLSSVNRVYRGDLETIVGKALEKDKTRRFASAAELAADLRRFMEHQPISARRPSGWYQLQKLARRNRPLAAGVAGIFLALVVGILATARAAQRARLAEQSAIRAEQAATTERDRALTAELRAEQEARNAAASQIEAQKERDQALKEKHRADTEAATAKAVNDFLQQDVLEQANNRMQAGPNRKPDPDLKIRTALDRAAAQIGGKFERQTLVEASIRRTIGMSYRDLGLYDEAQRHLERSLELRRRDSIGDDIETARTMNDLGEIFLEQGKAAQAEKVLTRALAIQQRTLGANHGATLATARDLTIAYGLLGDFLHAEQLSRSVLEAQRRTRGDEDRETLVTMGDLGNLYNKERKYGEAAQIFARLVEILPRKFGAEHPNTVSSMNNLATAYAGLHDYARAEQLYLEVRAIQLRVRGANHPNTLVTLSSLAGLYLRQKKYEQAEPLLTEVVDRRRAVLGAEHPDTVKMLDDLALARLELNKYAEAEFAIRESMSAHAKLPADSGARLIDQALLGRSLAGEKKYAEAEPLLLSGYEGLRKRAAPGTEVYLDRAGAWIVELYNDWHKPFEASDWTQKLHTANSK